MREYEYYTYIVQCSDGSYYTGVTSDLTARISQHQLGTSFTCYTYKRRPVKLVYNGYFSDVYEAIAWEKIIKRWSRKKKEALIRGDWQELPVLARSMYSLRVHRAMKTFRQTLKKILVFPHGSTGSP